MRSKKEWSSLSIGYSRKYSEALRKNGGASKCLRELASLLAELSKLGLQYAPSETKKILLAHPRATFIVGVITDED